MDYAKIYAANTFYRKTNIVCARTGQTWSVFVNKDIDHIMLVIDETDQLWHIDVVVREHVTGTELVDVVTAYLKSNFSALNLDDFLRSMGLIE